jgi:hypothetical protein
MVTTMTIFCTHSTTTMNLQEATDNFASSLTTAAVNLGSAVNKLQNEWQEVSASNADKRYVRFA